MNNQNLIIYQIPVLHKILEELNQELNFRIFDVSNVEELKKEIKDKKNYLILTYKKDFKLNELVLDKEPVKIFKLIERLNIQFLKQHFSDQSEIKIGKYKININSREILYKDIKLKLTEKEVNTILYLSKANKPVNIESLQKNVWGYSTDLETHTVETHIYILRKKILKIFNDSNFILSKKNGYEIK